MEDRKIASKVVVTLASDTCKRLAINLAPILIDGAAVAAADDADSKPKSRFINFNLLYVIFTPGSIPPARLSIYLHEHYSICTVANLNATMIMTTAII